MLDPNVRLGPNSDEVAAKVMDGEAIVINLSNGMYYSLDLAGGLVWQLIEARCRIDEIVEAVCAQYEVDPPQADADVRQLARELLEAGLVRMSADAPPVPGERSAPVAARLAYEAPQLNAYHDMAELLALDPPHPGLGDALSKPLDER